VPSNGKGRESGVKAGSSFVFPLKSNKLKITVPPLDLSFFFLGQLASVLLFLQGSRVIDKHSTATTTIITKPMHDIDITTPQRASLLLHQQN
jgi:hypothetical protein